jgi:hypothetical protein
MELVKSTKVEKGAYKEGNWTMFFLIANHLLILRSG